MQHAKELDANQCSILNETDRKEDAEEKEMETDLRTPKERNASKWKKSNEHNAESMHVERLGKETSNAKQKEADKKYECKNDDYTNIRSEKKISYENDIEIEEII